LAVHPQATLAALQLLYLLLILLMLLFLQRYRWPLMLVRLWLLMLYCLSLP
jgi:hypothetical protein